MAFFKLPRRLSKNKIRQQHLKTTPITSQHNDFYIVEFPKSGITWLSSLLANVALISSGRRELASFTAAHLFVPDIHVTRHIGPMVYDVPPVRMIKSHAEFNPNYNFVVYLSRNPLDVMKSYFRFSKENSGRGFSSFDEFCRSRELGIPAWKRHVTSWFEGGVIAQRVHLCRYEDLIRDAVEEIDLIGKNFGWNIERGAIELAISRSRVEKMKESEELYKSRNPRYNMTFIRGKNDFEIEDKTRSYIDRECENELRLLGYKK